MKRVYLVFLLPALLLVVGAGLVWFLLDYRAKESLKYLVDRESRGRYAFDARDVHVSFRNHSIQLEDAILYCRDTLNTDAWYNVRIPKIYLSITSWKTLLIQKKLIVDSLSILHPYIDIHVYKTAPRKKHVDFRATDILDYLDKALLHFNVHAFSLEDASFTYTDPQHPEPLHGGNINLSVSNFTGVNNVDSHLLGSDKVALSMGRQHWTFAGGKHEIDFARLRFDSRGQRFELDSFTFRQHSDTSRDIILAADQFFFNSRHLPAIYQKEELLLDTVTVVNPVLTMPVYSGRKLPKDSLGQLRYKNALFKHINVRFIDVMNGALVFQGKQQSSASTQKANLSVFNLDINPLRDPSLLTDSVRIKLDSISFLTKDGLYKLSIGHFTIHGEDAVFREVVYAPTLAGRADKDVRFQAPALVLRHISLGDLLQRHVRASGAELEEPTITLEDHTGATLPAHASGPPPPLSSARLALFYKTLHNISELIDVADFRITRGSAHYRSAGRMEGDVTGLNAHILLNQFFISDSLVDIKHAIPEWQIGNIDLKAAAFSLAVRGYRFDGLRQLSLGDYVRFTTAKGWDIQANNIRWKVLDWDAYQKTRAIRFDSLHIEALVVQDSSATQERARPAGDATGAGGAGVPTAPVAAHDLPRLYVGRLRIDRIVVRKPTGHTPLKADLQGFDVGNLHSEGRFLAWDRAHLHFSDVSAGSFLLVGEGAFDADEGIALSGLHIKTPELTAGFPGLHLDLRVHSTDFSHLAARALRLDKGQFRYTARGLKDTLHVEAAVGGRLTDLRLGADRKSLITGVQLYWEQGSLAWSQQGNLITAKGLSGSFHRDTMHLARGIPLRWQMLAGEASLQTGALAYQGPKIKAAAGRLSWDPEERRLSVSDFAVGPRLSQAESFAHARWQSDYVTVRGKDVTLSGIRLPEPGGDSTYRVRDIVADGLSVTASRDKHIPFHHGIEKLMPTQLIGQLGWPVSIDAVVLRHDTVDYRERSVATGQWSTIPINDLHGVVTHLRSRDNQGDTLCIEAGGTILGNRIHHFSYREVYGDSLSPFTAFFTAAPMDLTRFSEVSVPAAAVRVTSGRADTVYASWTGNKYAATGTMHFYYQGLTVRILNKDNLRKTGWLQRAETILVNVLLPDAKAKPASIYYERDREKFVFNYWVRTLTSGMASTLGLKKGRKYRNRVKTATGSGKRK
jgi:hypothetical protein